MRESPLEGALHVRVRGPSTVIEGEAAALAWLVFFCELDIFAVLYVLHLIGVL